MAERVFSLAVIWYHRSSVLCGAQAEADDLPFGPWSVMFPAATPAARIWSPDITLPPRPISPNDTAGHRHKNLWLPSLRASAV